MSRARPGPRVVPIWVGVSLLLFAAIATAHTQTGVGTLRTKATGLVALGVFVAGALYVARKRLLLSGLGTLHTWLTGHMVLGAVLIPAVLVHAGFQDIGTEGRILYALVFAQLATGAWGSWELSATPRRFARFASDDYGDPAAIRNRLNVLNDDVESTLKRRTPELRRWFARYEPAMNGSREPVAACEDYGPGNERHATALHAKVVEIARLWTLRRRIEEVSRRSRLWLWFHVPSTVALVFFVLAHVLRKA